MTNNDILRRVRYIFDLNDDKMISIFGQADRVVTRSEISDWMKSEENEEYKKLNDETLATYLNGFINEKRGKREGAQPVPEKRLTNNAIFMKLKIALNLQSEDIIEIMNLSEFVLSKHELSAFFRKEGHKHYRECKDQILRIFLKGLQIQHRKDDDSDEEFSWEK
ncbi:MAG: DUF1456 family protein [Woeseiaceae bacterium]